MRLNRACLLLVASSSYASAPAALQRPRICSSISCWYPSSSSCAAPRHGQHPSPPRTTAMRSAGCYGTTAPEVSPVSRRPCVPCHPHSSKVPPLQRPGMVPDNRPVPSDLPSEKWPTILPLQDNLLGPGASAQVWRGAWHSTISGGIWHSAIATIKEAGGMYHESHINMFFSVRAV